MRIYHPVSSALVIIANISEAMLSFIYLYQCSVGSYPVSKSLGRVIFVVFTGYRSYILIITQYTVRILYFDWKRLYSGQPLCCVENSAYSAAEIYTCWDYMNYLAAELRQISPSRAAEI